ncbi:MAG: fluoride efflux transporter CrcB [Pseudomonadota bacterium]
MGVYGFLAVGLGAALGAWLRWGLGQALNHVSPTLPLGTLTANLLGGYGAGVAIAVFTQNSSLPPEAGLFIITGFLGGLTTYSTFSAEVVAAFCREEYFWSGITVITHLGGSLLMTVFGILTVGLFG